MAFVPLPVLLGVQLPIREEGYVGRQEKRRVKLDFHWR